MRKSYWAVATLAAILTGVSGTAMAQSTNTRQPKDQPAATENTHVGDDIVVTATRREEKLQDVPVAVTAFTPDNLAAKGILKLGDLARVTPSMVISRFVGMPSGISFGIRGQRQSDVRINLDSAVVTYMGEVPLHLPFGLGVTGFLDLKSVQVLRGPQGTLFGKNSVGGAVLLTPNEPTGVLEGSAKFEVGNYSKIGGQAVANLPLSENAAIRVAAVVGSRDGYLHDRGGGPALASEKFYGGRIALKITSGSVTSTTFADYSRYTGSGSAGEIVAVNPAGLAQNVPVRPGGAPVGLAGLNAILAENQSADFWSVRVNRPLRQKTWSWSVSNKTELAVNDSLTIKNILAYRDLYSDSDVDVTGNPVTILASTPVAFGNQLTEEFQLNYKSGPVNVIGGYFFFSEKGGDQNRFENLRGLTRTVGANVVPLGGEARLNDRIRNRQHSLYVEGTLDLGQLHLTAGGRYTWDYRYREAENLVYRDPAYYPAGVPVTVCQMRELTYPNCFFSNQVSYQKFTHNLTARYEFTPDQQVYVSWRTGYRAGGHILGPSTVLADVPFRPETTSNYEVGYKSKFDLGGDTRLRLNLAAYYNKYNDIQKSQNARSADGTSLVTRIVNAAKATLYGFEAEAGLDLGPNVGVNVSYNYFHGKYDEWLVDGATPGTKIDLSATPWSFTPQHMISASVRYTVPLGEESSLTFQPTYTYQSKVYLEDSPDANMLQQGYGILSARIEYAVNKTVKVGIWGNNLTKTKYFVSGQNTYNTAGVDSLYAGEPRFFGMDVSFKF